MAAMLLGSRWPTLLTLTAMPATWWSAAVRCVHGPMLTGRACFVQVVLAIEPTNCNQKGVMLSGCYCHI